MQKVLSNKSIINIAKSALLCSLGIIIFFTAYIFEILHNQNTVGAFEENTLTKTSEEQHLETTTVTTTSKTFETPTEISIPALELQNLNISKGYIKDGTWSLSDTEALYLTSSGKLGEGYNTILYAHGKTGLFGGLSKLNPGDRIIIKGNSDNLYVFEVTSVSTVRYDELDKLRTETPDSLTLFTCSDIIEFSRTLVRAELINPTQD